MPDLDRIEVPIGVEYFSKLAKNEKPIKYYCYNYGCDTFIAVAGYGKSSLLKHIIVKLYYMTNRQIIIFDRANEWASSITRPNWKSKEPQSIKKYHIIRNYSVKVSDLDSRDWFFIVRNLGVEVANWISRVAIQGITEHQDDPNRFYNMLRLLPVSKEELKQWNTKFGHCIKLDEWVMAQVKVSIVSKMRDLKERFYGSETCNKRKVRYIDDWYKEVTKTKCCIIDMGIDGYSPDSFVGFMVGHILKELAVYDGKYLVKMKPIIAVEEADYLCGDENKTPFYKSTEMLLSYIAKYRKKDVKIFFISQTYSQLHSELRKYTRAEIFGELDRSDDSIRNELWKKIEQSCNLFWGVRPFCYINKIEGGFARPMFFFPIEPCCNIETQGVIFKEFKDE